MYVLSKGDNMKNKTIAILGFLMATSASVSAFAKVDVLCEKKREHVIRSVCGRSSSDEKRKECTTFYKNAACGTVALHEAADND